MRKILLKSALIALWFTQVAATNLPDLPENLAVHDPSGALSSTTIAELAQANEELHELNGAEIFFNIMEFPPVRASMSEYNLQLFNHWGIGSVERNNGVLFSLATITGEYHLTVGDGLVSHMPRSELDILLEEYFFADYDAGDLDAAVLNLYGGIAERLLQIFPPANAPDNTASNSSNATNAANTPATESGGSNILGTVFAVILVIFVIFILIKLSSGGGSGNRRGRGRSGFSSGGGFKAPRRSRAPGFGTGVGAGLLGGFLLGRASNRQRNSGGSSPRSSAPPPPQSFTRGGSTRGGGTGGTLGGLIGGATSRSSSRGGSGLLGGGSSRGASRGGGFTRGGSTRGGGAGGRRR